MIVYFDMLACARSPQPQECSLESSCQSLFHLCLSQPTPNQRAGIQSRIQSVGCSVHCEVLSVVCVIQGAPLFSVVFSVDCVIKCEVISVHCVVISVYCVLQCTMYMAQCEYDSVHYIVCTLKFTLCFVQCAAG